MAEWQWLTLNKANETVNMDIMKHFKNRDQEF